LGERKGGKPSGVQVIDWRVKLNRGAGEILLIPGRRHEKLDCELTACKSLQRFSVIALRRGSAQHFITCLPGAGRWRSRFIFHSAPAVAELKKIPQWLPIYHEVPADSSIDLMAGNVQLVQGEKKAWNSMIPILDRPLAKYPYGAVNRLDAAWGQITTSLVHHLPPAACQVGGRYSGCKSARTLSPRHAGRLRVIAH